MLRYFCDHALVLHVSGNPVTQTETKTERTNMKTTYRNFTITIGRFGFNVEGINCFGARSELAAKLAIDRYLDGDSNPQCK